MDLGLGGRVAIVIGGGRGIGAAAALALAREGAHVAPLSRTAGEVENVGAGARALGVKAVPIACDAADRAALDAAFARVEQELGPPTLLILCASAHFAPRKLHMIDDAEIKQLLALDVESQVAACKRALPGMIEARFGRIVAVGSMAARFGVPGGTLYGAGKAFLEGLVRGLALDYTRRGVTANAISTGFIDTERLRKRTAGDPAALDRLVNGTAARRLPSPDELGNLIAFLCSPHAAAITGAVIDFTAGAHLNNLW
ncbi:MAG: SDR family NAD(P)-dependent oxidoreductase [Myxococcales bacterium]|nr:SDR family oxidoreductase [Myxococcales bacterium]